MIIDAKFAEINNELQADFGILSKGERGEKGEPFTYEDFTEQQLKELTNTAQVENHEKRITNLERKISNEYFVTEDSKDVPLNVCPYAEIVKVGGMSYRDEATNTLKHAKVTEIKSVGKNLVDVSKALNSNFVDNGDGTYTGTNNGNGQRFSAKVEINIPPNSTIYYSATKKGGNLNEDWKGMQIAFINGSTDIGTMNMNSTKVFPKGATHIRFYIDGDEANGAYITVKDIQIEYGSVKTEYEPYIGTLDTFAIPEAVQVLEDFGLGVSAEYNNHIEYTEDGKVKYVQMCKKVVFDGTERWYTSNASGGYKRVYTELQKIAISVTSSTELTPSLCNYYPVQTSEDTYRKVTGFSISANGKSLYFYDDNFQDDADWEAHLAELYAQGNPLTIVYPLAEPIVTDITDLMSIDNFIKVEGGGTIVAVNEYSLDVPTEMTYLLKEGSI